MFRKILVPLDGSDLAASILPQIELLARGYNAQVTLMTVGSSDLGEGREPAAPQPEAPTAKYLEQTAAALRARGLEANWVYRQGVPGREIVAYAEANQMDLIALATHGSGEFAWVIGSVAKKVITHTTTPVLVMRVLEPAPPVLKGEMYYSLQTP